MFVDPGSNNSGFYELQAVLTHKGRSSSSGHYVAWVRREKGANSHAASIVNTPFNILSLCFFLFLSQTSGSCSTTIRSLPSNQKTFSSFPEEVSFVTNNFPRKPVNNMTSPFHQVIGTAPTSCCTALAFCKLTLHNRTPHLLPLTSARPPRRKRNRQWSREESSYSCCLYNFLLPDIST